MTTARALERTTPKRIQRKRAKGWRMPEGAVYVGRPTKWGNPNDWREYEIRQGDVPWDVDPKSFARQLAADQFRADLSDGVLTVSVADIRSELRGKDLACWCPLGQRCHADVLLELANK